jgi:hypothetical protein
LIGLEAGTGGLIGLEAGTGGLIGSEVGTGGLIGSEGGTGLVSTGAYYFFVSSLLVGSFFFGFLAMHYSYILTNSSMVRVMLLAFNQFSTSIIHCCTYASYSACIFFLSASVCLALG